MATKTAAKKTNTKQHKNTKKSNNRTPIIIAAAAGTLVVCAVAAYGIGFAYFSGKFLSQTFINGKDVSGQKYEKVCEEMGTVSKTEKLTITTADGKSVEIDGSDFGYSTDGSTHLKKIFDEQKHSEWLSSLFKKSEFTYTETVSFDTDKLEAAINKQSWGGTKTVNAKLKLSADKQSYDIVAETIGTKVTSMANLYTIVENSLKSGSLSVKLTSSSACYEKPTVTAESLKSKKEKLDKMFSMSISYDFDYTTEKLTGDTLVKMITFSDDGTFAVDKDKAMKYIETLAKKYDTYNTVRKFKSTKQGNIYVPASSDAKYGWWIDQEKTCNALVKMLQKGEAVESVKPVYFSTGSFKFTGVSSARSATDDIGKTYVEIDLTAQHLWYYKDGKKKFECDIVSGQTTTKARMTFPGVYKLWQKNRNYRMKDTNADGESWDTTCYYWNRIAIVGIGLHDTVSRDAFGGNIYTYLGSHGCINMPLSGAKYIYNNVSLGTPVVIYYKSAKTFDSTIKSSSNS